MLSDRTLTDTFGMSSRSVALWGDALRAVTVGVSALLLAGFTAVYVPTVQNTISNRRLQDFGTFYDAAVRFRSGADLYGPGETRGVAEALNLNPPHFHLLLWPLTPLPPARAFALWMLLSGVALSVSLALVIRTLRLGGWAIATLLTLSYVSPAMFATLITGQVGALLMLPFTLAWVNATRRSSISALWLGLSASIKPLFLIFVPVSARVGEWRAAATLTASAIAVFALGVVIFGIDAYRAWITDLLSVTWAEHYMNASLLGLIERSLSASEWQQQPIANLPWAVTPLWAIAAGALAGATLWRVTRIAGRDQRYLFVTAAAMLVSPLAWVYYSWFLIPPLAGCFAAAPGRPPARWMLLIAVAGLLMPPPLVRAALWWGSGVGTLTLGSVYCWALIAIWIAGWRSSEPAVPATAP